MLNRREDMPKLLQIDSCRGILSTGKISEQIGALARESGWETYIAHGARYVGPSNMVSYQIGTKFSEYLHYVKSSLLDMHGLGSSYQTKRLIRWIDKIKPDIIQLHCIHGYYLNYHILFDYLNSTNIPIVWTFHDCWAFTGHCAHFVSADCMSWKDGECGKCSLIKEYPKAFIDRSRKNFSLKKELFTSNHNIRIVSVSEWLSHYIQESFFKTCDIRIINNGVDLQTFTVDASCPNLTNIKEEDKVVLGVSSVWNDSKGFGDFKKLRQLLPTNIKIILVGLNPEQILELPDGVIGVERTRSATELAGYYALADVFVNPTYADSFPTVNLEAIACGTPVITYRTGGSPEAVTPETGVVVEQGHLNDLHNAINEVLQNGKDYYKQACRKRAEEYFDKTKCFEQYINLYENILRQRK